MAFSTHLIVFCTLAIVWKTVDMLGTTASTYKLNVKRLDVCNDEGTGQIHFGSKIRHIGNGKYVYNSTVYLLVPLDDKLKATLEVQQWGNGGYKPHFIDYATNNCEEFWIYLEDFILRLSKAAGIEIRKCPIPKGNFTVVDFPLDDLKFNNIPALPYNKYRSFTTLYYNGVKVGCVVVYIEVEP